MFDEKNLLRCLILFGLMNLSLLLHAADIETIQLSYRSADSLSQIIKPLLEPSESVIANGSMLIVKANTAKIDEIRKLVRQLDKPQHRLSITIAQGRGLSLEILNAGKAGGHVYQTQTDVQTQRIQTLDGETAQIRFGEQFPLKSEAIIGYGASGQASTQGGQVILGQAQAVPYKEISTGFDVIPRLFGQRVMLDVMPWSERRNIANGISSHDAHTLLNSELSEWVEIGGQISTQELNDQGQYAHHYSTRGNAVKMFVKVEDLDASKP